MGAAGTAGGTGDSAGDSGVFAGWGAAVLDDGGFKAEKGEPGAVAKPSRDSY